jgi:type IV pilus assembly protein PilN
MNFDINLATKVYVDFRKVNLILTLLMVILISWISLSIYKLSLNIEMTQKFGEYKSRKLSGAKASKVSESDYSKFLAEVKSVNTILYNRSYDWLALLNNLERLVPDGVALTGLDPSGKGEFLKLSATARDFSSIRKFIENLESSKSFTEVYLVDQTSVKTANKQKGINFTVTCRASIL